MTETIPSIEGNPVSWWKRAFANSAGKAVRMVGFSQSCYYFSFHEFPTAIAAGSIHALVIHRAEVFPVLNEKTSLGQVTATHFAGEALDVKVLGLDTEHFAFTWLLTFMAVDDRLLSGGVRFLGMGHSRRHGSGSGSWRREAASLGG